MRPVSNPTVPAFVRDYQVIDTFKEIEEVAKSLDFVQGNIAARRVFFDDTLIFLEGNQHRDHKNLLAQLMSREALAYYELHLLDPVIGKVLEDLKGQRDADGTVRTDLVPLMLVMLRQISARVIGVDGVDTPERVELFGHLASTVGLGSASHFAVEKDRVMAEGKAALNLLVDEFLQRSLDRRMALAAEFKAGKIDRQALPRDLLMTLCLTDDLSRPDDAGKEIPYIWRQCALFMNASIQTTSHMLPHVFVHLHEWALEHPEERALFADEEFLRRAIGESMRLHQATPVRFRTALSDVTLSTGRTVKKDEMVALFVTPANLETGIFGEDARYFNPHRQVPDGIMQWGMAFGTGTHHCLARNLVTGIRGRTDTKFGNDGTALKIVKTFYGLGCTLDPDRPPQRRTDSYHDSYASVPIILHGL